MICISSKRLKRDRSEEASSSFPPEEYLTSQGLTSSVLNNGLRGMLNDSTFCRQLFRVVNALLAEDGLLRLLVTMDENLKTSDFRDIIYMFSDRSAS